MTKAYTWKLYEWNNDKILINYQSSWNVHLILTITQQTAKPWNLNWATHNTGERSVRYKVQFRWVRELFHSQRKLQSRFQWWRQRSKGARSFRGQKILQPGHPDALFSSKKLTFFSCRLQNTGRQCRFTIKIKQIKDGDRAMDLPTRSLDVARSGVATPLHILHANLWKYYVLCIQFNKTMKLYSLSLLTKFIPETEQKWHVLTVGNAAENKHSCYNFCYFLCDCTSVHNVVHSAQQCTLECIPFTQILHKGVPE